MIPDAEELRTRLPDPSVMAEEVVFFCSDQAERITGERIVAIEFKEWRIAHSGRKS